MIRMSRRVVLGGLLLLPVAARAGGGTLTIADAWTRPGLPNRPSAIYLTVSNSMWKDARLIGASSPMFERIEMHLSASKDGIMTMQPVASVDVPSGDEAIFEPGGLHFMAFGPSEPLEEGVSFPLTLAFEGIGEIETTVTVMPMTHTGSDHGHGGHGGGS